ncbi:hypothetical protein HQ563_15290 [bacterium]|nr:hypothetical protein [bacterium]
MRYGFGHGSAIIASALALVAAGCVLSNSGGASVPEGAREDRKVVYLVPDLPTFLYYLSRWDGEKRFPIFMARNRYFEKFVREYKPDTILRAPRRKLKNVDSDMLRGAVCASWSKETIADLRRGVSRNGFKEQLRRSGLKSRGIVLTDLEAKQLPAALALAAAHREMLDFLRVGSSIRRVKLSGAMSFEQKEEVRKNIIKTIERWGASYKGLGDDIDYITLALDLPIAYMGVAPGTAGKQRLCLDDGINRLTPNGSLPSSKTEKKKAEKPRGYCYAYVGRLLEVEQGMALYQAMCSIFLGTSKALFFDRWPERWGLRAREGWWVMQGNVHSDLVRKNESSMARWRKLVGNLNPYGFVHVSSAGNAAQWGDGKVSDIPESVPAIVYFAHSFSAANPYDEMTIAGRWLRSGAYIYYGAISEPYAQSFNMPRTVSLGAVAGEALGEAFQAKRMLPARFTFPWKQIYIGDPLHRIAFVEDKTELELSRKFREAVGMIREMNLGPAIEVLEDALESADDAAERDRIWDVLNKTFRLRFFAIRTKRIPVEKHLDPFFVDSWYNDTYYPNGKPATAVALNKRLNLFQKELVRLYEGLYRTIEKRPRLKEFLGSEIAEMKKDAAFVKIWISVGPFNKAEDASPDNPFGPEKVLRLGATWQASGGKTGWQAAMVNPDDNTLDLAAIYKEDDFIIYASCFPVLMRDIAEDVRLNVSATGKVEAWLNNVFVGSVSGSGKEDKQEGSIDLRLEPGENLLSFKVFRKGKYCGLSARLTDQRGDYLEDVQYADAVSKLSAAGTKIDPETWRLWK